MVNDVSPILGILYLYMLQHFQHNSELFYSVFDQCNAVMFCLNLILGLIYKNSA